MPRVSHRYQHGPGSRNLPLHKTATASMARHFPTVVVAISAKIAKVSSLSRDVSNLSSNQKENKNKSRKNRSRKCLVCHQTKSLRWQGEEDCCGYESYTGFYFCSNNGKRTCFQFGTCHCSLLSSLKEGCDNDVDIQIISNAMGSIVQCGQCAKLMMGGGFGCAFRAEFRGIPENFRFWTLFRPNFFRFQFRFRTEKAFPPSLLLFYLLINYLPATNFCVIFWQKLPEFRNWKWKFRFPTLQRAAGFQRKTQPRGRVDIAIISIAPSGCGCWYKTSGIALASALASAPPSVPVWYWFWSSRQRSYITLSLLAGRSWHSPCCRYSIPRRTAYTGRLGLFLR